jgi:hypothetical protein
VQAIPHRTFCACGATARLNGSVRRGSVRVNSAREQGRPILIGGFRSHLGLLDAQVRLLIPEVDLKVPAPQKILEKILQGHLRIGADQKGRLAIEQFAAIFETVQLRRVFGIVVRT